MVRQTDKQTDRQTDSYLVVLHEGGNPGLECVHHVIHQVDFHLRPAVVGKVTYVNGRPDLWLGQVVTIVIKILWLLKKKKERNKFKVNIFCKFKHSSNRILLDL